jgi:photosystem II PsbY protein
MHFDFRVLIVLLPVLLAAGWAVRNILPYALRQFESFFNASK